MTTSVECHSVTEPAVTCSAKSQKEFKRVVDKLGIELAPIIPGRNWPYLRTYVSSLILTLFFLGHLFLEADATSVMGPYPEVLRYVPIPAVRTRIHRLHQP